MYGPSPLLFKTAGSFAALVTTETQWSDSPLMSVKLMGSLAGILVMRLEARLQLCSVTLFISRNTASGTWVSWHSLRSATQQYSTVQLNQMSFFQ